MRRWVGSIISGRSCASPRRRRAGPGLRCRSAITSRRGRRDRSHRRPMTDIQFGLMLRAQFPAGGDMQLRFAELVEQARLADRLGFASITKRMHYSAAPWWDLQQFPFLSRIMADAPHLRLHFGLVLLSLPQPLDIAEQIASVDGLSGRNAIPGVALR